MKIDVFDSYAQTNDGQIMHFDVFVKSGTAKEQALLYGREWLKSIGETSASLDQSRCNFCHSQIANPAVQQAVKADGFYILEMEGCPSYV